MTTNLVTVQPTDTALAAATLLAEYQVSCVAVVDPTAAGVLRQDVLRFQARQLNLAKLSVRAIMRDLQLCLKLEDSLWLAYQEMSQHHLPYLVVATPEQQPLGVISQSDLLCG